jgi:Fur family zinc uptake transcriptional regulator
MGKASAAFAAPCARARPNTDNRPLSQNEKLVYAQLESADTPLKAYGLLERLHDQGLRAPMTIYRALDSLIARGLVRKIASLNAFIPLGSARRAGISAVVTCSKCGRAQILDLDRAVVQRMFAPAGMAISDIHLEATAECAEGDCGAKRTGSAELSCSGLL